MAAAKRRSSVRRSASTKKKTASKSRRAARVPRAPRRRRRAATRRAAVKRVAATPKAPRRRRKAAKKASKKRKAKKTKKVVRRKSARKPRKPKTVGKKWQVYKGTRVRTAGGLTKADLVMNNRGKVVSKKRNKRGLKLFKSTRMGAWVAACAKARKELNLTGFVPCKKGSAYYTLTRKYFD